LRHLPAKVRTVSTLRSRFYSKDVGGPLSYAGIFSYYIKKREQIQFFWTFFSLS